MRRLFQSVLDGVPASFQQSPGRNHSIVQLFGYRSLGVVHVSFDPLGGFFDLFPDARAYGGSSGPKFFESALHGTPFLSSNPARRGPNLSAIRV
jgi:hypothetical protein